MKKILYVVFGALIGFSISLSTPTLAATVKSITAKINSSVNLVVNGEKVKLSAQPINYNNLNYLPIGEIGRALGATVNYDKASDSIVITDQVVSNEEIVKSQDNQEIVQIAPAEPEINIPRDTTTKTEVTKALIGKTITKDGISVTIEKVEHNKEKEIIGDTVVEGGYKVYLSITNDNPSSSVTGLGADMVFRTDSTANDELLNNLGNFNYLKIDDKYYSGLPLPYGKTATGFVYYQTDKDIQINEIDYYLNMNNTKQIDPMGTWTIK